jgi:hypothetical protein
MRRNSVQEGGEMTCYAARNAPSFFQKEFYMKRRMFAIGFTLLAVSLYAQNTSDFEIQGNDDGTMTILNYKGMAKEIVIPETIFNMPVTRLREKAFSQKGLTKVTIPKTITFIGDETFSRNQLTSVTIPEAVEYIGNSAFYNNQLTSVAIPANVTVIGSRAFRENRLTAVSVPDSVVYIGGSAFSDNQITAITLGAGVKYIGEGAFSYHRASSITIPDGVVFIGEQAFYPRTSNSLTNIRIGKYVMFGTSYSGGAFYNNGDFDTIYQNNDKRVGTYAYANGNWTYTP